MFTNNFDPVAFEIFSLEIRWYSLSYIVGISAGWFLSKKIFISDHKLKDKFDDYLSYLIVGIIIGGRLGYVFFYNFDYYLNYPFDIFKICVNQISITSSYTSIINQNINFNRFE